MRHYYPFGASSPLLERGELRSRGSWEALRSEERDTPFSISADRDDWLRDCTSSVSKDGSGDVAERAAAIVSTVRDRDLTGVYSFGIGGGYLEFNLKREAPDLWLSVSDFGRVWFDRMNSVFVECDEIKMIDLKKDNYPSDSSRLYLLHRIETEFTDREWRAIFDRLAEAHADYVLLLPNALLTPRYWWREVKRRVKHVLSGVPCSFAGYVRNLASLRALWKRHYDCIDQRQYGYLRGYLLRLKRRA